MLLRTNLKGEFRFWLMEFMSNVLQKIPTEYFTLDR